MRNVASSMAVSPPPTTRSSLSGKNAASQVAQAETPCPMRRFSDSSPRSRAVAPVDTGFYDVGVLEMSEEARVVARLVDEPSRLVDRQPGEVTQIDELRNLWLLFLELRQGVVEGDEVGMPA